MRFLLLRLMVINMKNIIERAKAPTPKFFKKVRTIGLVLTASGGAILASPLVLPIALLSAAGYVTLAGGVMSALGQMAVKQEPDNE